jgi:hypothetical protein
VLEDGPWPTPNPDRPDYHLRPDSPLLAAGNPAYSPSLDLTGALRTGIEIGALIAGESVVEVSAEAAGGPTPLPAAGEGTGTITYTLYDGHIFRLAAREGAAPEDISAALNTLAPGSDDEWLNIAPDGRWLLLSTDRFDPECVGWPCLAVVVSDLSAGEVIRTGGSVVRAEGFSAIASVGDLIAYPLVVYTADGGPHTLDLWATTRDDSGWSAPLLLTGDSTYDWNHQPALAADGSRVIFDCGSEPYGAEGTAICEVNTDGTGFRVVITPADSPTGFGVSEALHQPDYAPSGAIVFEGQWAGEQIWLLAAGAAEATRPTDAFGNDNSPCVLPDGRIVSLWLNRPGNDPGYHEIKVMTPDGSSYYMALSGFEVGDFGLGCGG